MELNVAPVLILLTTISLFYSAFAFTLNEKNAILDEIGKIEKPVESTFDKCRVNFDAVKNNDTKLANACMDFVSNYTNHMKRLINETKNDMIEILINN